MKSILKKSAVLVAAALAITFTATLPANAYGPPPDRDWRSHERFAHHYRYAHPVPPPHYVYAPPVVYAPPPPPESSGLSLILPIHIN